MEIREYIYIYIYAVSRNKLFANIHTFDFLDEGDSGALIYDITTSNLNLHTLFYVTSKHHDS